MSYLLMEIIVYLLIAGLIGFIVGWKVKGGTEDKNSPKSTNKDTIATTSNSSTDTNKTTTQTTKTEINISSPTLLTQAREEGKDNLSLIKGVGPKLEDRLNKLGIYHLDQVASWTAEEQAWIGIEILFPKKVEREEWVKQAKELSKS